MKGRIRRKIQSKQYATDIIEFDQSGSDTQVISISGGRDFYLNEIVIWTDRETQPNDDIRIRFEDNTSDMLWSDKPVNLQAFVNNDRRLDFKRDLAHKTDVTVRIDNQTGEALKIQVIFNGYEQKVRPESNKERLTQG